MLAKFSFSRPQDAISTCACDGNVAFCGFFCRLFWCSLTSVLLRERQGGGIARGERRAEQRNKGIKRSTRKGGQAFVYEYRRGPSFEAGTGTRARVLAEPLELGW